MLGEYDKNKKTIVIVDDDVGLSIMLRKDIKKLLNKNGIDSSKFNILVFNTREAGTELYNKTKDANFRVDYAFLDITLGGSELIEGYSEKLDGIDLYKYLQDSYDTRSIIITGHIIKKSQKQNREFLVKFKRIVGKDIEECYILKDVPLKHKEQDIKRILPELFEE